MPTTPIVSVTKAPRRSAVRTMSRRRSTASRSMPTTNVGGGASPSSLTAQESHRTPVTASGPASACPGPGVDAVVDGLPALAQLQRAEGVDHHSQLLEPLRTERGLDRRRLRPVRVPTRVQRDRSEPDPGTLPRLVVAAAVEHHLVGV